MADDITIVVGVQDKGILTAIDKTNRLEANVRKLSKALDGGKITGDQFSKALDKMAKMSKGYGDQVQKYATALKASKKAQEEAAAAERQAKVEAQQYAKARREATEANRQFDIEQKKAAIATQQAAAEEERLKNKFVEGYAAMNLYSKELNELAMARKANIITTDQQRLAVERLNEEMSTGTGRFSGYGASLQMATRGNNQLGVATQQAGYQIGDFLVQIQSGTNPIVAFGQQATQLVGVLPLVAGQLGLTTKAAIALSAGLGIGIPLFTAIAAVVGTFAYEAFSASKANEAFEETMKSLKEETEAAALEIERLNRGLATTAQAQADTKIRALRDEVERLRVAAENADVEGYAFAAEALRDAEAKLALAEKELQLSKDTLAQEKARSDYEKFRADMLERSVSASQALLDETAAAVAAVQEVGERVKKLEEEYGKTVVQAALLAGLDIEKGINLAAIAASNLSSEMKAALASALGLADLAVKYNMFEGSAGAGMLRRYGGRGTVSDKDPVVGETGESIYKEPPKTRGGGSKADPLAALIEEQRQRKILLGLTGEQRTLQEAIFQVTNKLGDATKTMSNAQIEALAKENLMLEQQEKLYEEKISKQQEIANLLQSSMETAFMSIVEGTQSAKDAFKQMAADIIKELYRVLVVQQMVGSFKSGGGGILGSIFGALQADGGVWKGGSQVQAFANGGIVGGPTMFPMSGGKTGLMGEAGPEAIMPLKRGANGKLGVEVQGGAGTVVVNNNFTVQANGDESVKRIVQQQIPRIAEATKAAVVDSKRRGGSYGRAFG